MVHDEGNADCHDRLVLFQKKFHVVISHVLKDPTSLSECSCGLFLPEGGVSVS